MRPWKGRDRKAKYGRASSILWSQLMKLMFLRRHGVCLGHAKSDITLTTWQSKREDGRK